MPGEAMVSQAQEMMFKQAFLRVTPANEVQTITITGSPTGGTFKLRYEGQITNTIAHNANSATVTTELAALSNIGSGNIVVTGTNPNFSAMFTVALSDTPLALIELDTNSLTGGTTPSVAIARTQAGAGATRQYYYVGLSTQTREAAGDATTLATIPELTVANGYARIRVKTDGVDIVLSATSGFWDFTTKEVTFTASGGNWSTCNGVFLADVPSGTTGKLWAFRTVTPFTLLDGQSQGIKLREAAADPI